MLKELNDCHSNIPVYVNPDHIDYARPSRDDPQTTGGEKVSGTVNRTSDSMKKLSSEWPKTSLATPPRLVIIYNSTLYALWKFDQVHPSAWRIWRLAPDPRPFHEKKEQPFRRPFRAFFQSLLTNCINQQFG